MTDGTDVETLVAEPYGALGVRPVINATGHETSLTGSLVPPEVLSAMAAAARQYVPLRALQLATGARVAQTIGAPAALITTGAAGAMFLATAAALAGLDRERALRLPRTHPGTPNEVIVWRMARPNYLYPPCEAAGGVLVEVDTPDAAPLRPSHFTDALSNRTAAIMLMIHTLDEARDRTGGWEEIVGGVAREAQTAGVPVFVDAAAELPPRALVPRLFELGAAAVMLSGGKAIRGPQSSGILAARPALIEAALIHCPPDRMLGRMLKVGKEELVGLTAAVQHFWALDEDTQLAGWRAMCETVVRAVHGIAGARASVVEGVPGYGRPPVVPKAFLRLENGEAAVRRVAELLLAEDPPIHIHRRSDGIIVNPMALEPGQDEIVAARLVAALRA